MVMEFVPIVVGATVWARQWADKTVRCRCNNAATVVIVNSGRSKVERAVHLMRSLFFLACYNASVFAVHIPGVENGAADALSRHNYVCRYQEPDCTPQEYL